LTGEGIWHALRSGYLAGELAAASASRRGTPEELVRRYRRAVSREVVWPTAARRGLEAMTTFIVERELYRSPLVRRMLEWGYSGSRLEVSKTTAP
jgi:flavin-dependent dehydrogenase